MAKGLVAACVLALAASAHAAADASCSQGLSQIEALEAQVSATQSQAAACAAGGEIEPYNPMWAPWPIHAWPKAGTGSCTKMQAHATYIQTQNQAQIATIQSAMNSAGC